MSVAGGAALLQRLYEEGALSYPRSDHDALSEESVEILARVAERHRLPFDGANIPRFHPTAERPHEAVHPLFDAATKINLDIPSRMLSTADRLMHDLTRAWLRRCAEIDFETADTAGLPEWAQELAWIRPATTQRHAALIFEEERAPRARLTLYQPDLIALGVLDVHRLGRPSTLAVHAQHIADRGVLDVNGMTVEGRRLLADSPEVLAIPTTSSTIESIVDGTIGAECPAIMPSTSDITLARLAQVIEYAVPELKPRFARAIEDQALSDSSEFAPSNRETEDDLRRPVFLWPWLTLAEEEQSVERIDDRKRQEELRRREEERERMEAPAETSLPQPGGGHAAPLLR